MFTRVKDIRKGDILFLISCSEIIRKEERDRYQYCFVIHASDLPKGRGWSPHIWEILLGSTELTITLLEADDPVDSGAIWSKLKVEVPKHCIVEEIDRIIFEAELALMDKAIDLVLVGHLGKTQEGTPTFYPKRSPSDNKVDIECSIESIFDLLRSADSNRYPVHFDHEGHTYELIIKKSLVNKQEVE